MIENNIYTNPPTSDIALAWAHVFLKLWEQPKHKRDPIAIVIEADKNSPQAVHENKVIRNALDAQLRGNVKMKSIRETATTIFPYENWIRLGKPNCAELSEWYKSKYLPRHRARSKVLKRKLRDTYFHRMINAEGVTSDGEKRSVDQLDHVIQIWKKNRSIRPSALCVSCIDPAKDHNGAVLSGFPCLQQVSFTYEKDLLQVHAYYPSQLIFERAYGNYLGLFQLGMFMAEQVGLQFDKLICFVGKPKMSDLPMKNLSSLHSKIVSQIK